MWAISFLFSSISSSFSGLWLVEAHRLLSHGGSDTPLDDAEVLVSWFGVGDVYTVLFGTMQNKIKVRIRTWWGLTGGGVFKNKAEPGNDPLGTVTGFGPFLGGNTCLLH